MADVNKELTDPDVKALTFKWASGHVVKKNVDLSTKISQILAMLEQNAESLMIFEGNILSIEDEIGQ